MMSAAMSKSSPSEESPPDLTFDRIDPCTGIDGSRRADANDEGDDDGRRDDGNGEDLDPLRDVFRQLPVTDLQPFGFFQHGAREAALEPAIRALHLVAGTIAAPI